MLESMRESTGLGGGGIATVPRASLRSRFAADFKSPKNAAPNARSPLGELKTNVKHFEKSVTPKSEGMKSKKTTSNTNTPVGRKVAAPAAIEIETPAKVEEDVLQSTFDFVKDCAMWTNPARSSLAFSLGFLSLLTWHYVESGLVEFRPLTSLAYCGLIMLAGNFFGAIFFKSFTPKPMISEAQAERVSNVIRSILVSGAPALNGAFSGTDASRTLQAAFSMWTLITLNQFMSLSLICLLGHCALFTMPLLFKNFEGEFRKKANVAKVVLRNSWNGVNMERKYKLGLIGSVLGMLWVLCSLHTKITSLFVAVIAFRCFLKPSEVQSITNAAAPMTERVQRKAKRISMGASEILRDSIGLRSVLLSPTKES